MIGKADSENAAAVEMLRRHNVSFHRVIQSIARKQASVTGCKACESASEVDEGVGSAIRASVLAALLAIPGILPAKALERDISTARQEQSSPSDGGYRKAVNGEGRNVGRIGGYTKVQAANIIARTIFGEGRGESHDGRLAIATTLWNRGRHTPYGTVLACIRPKAYSCWNGVGSSYFEPSSYVNSLPSGLRNRLNDEKAVFAWNDCINIATDLVEGRFRPYFTDGNYTHYVTVALYNNPKSEGRWFWKKPGKVLGNHIFFTLKDANSPAIGKRRAKGVPTAVKKAATHQKKTVVAKRPLAKTR